LPGIISNLFEHRLLYDMEKNIQTLMEMLRDSESKKLEAERNLVMAELEVRQALSKTLGGYAGTFLGVGICAAAIEIGHWACETSPIAVCVYDDWSDPIHDNCLYCNNPEERK